MKVLRVKIIVQKFKLEGIWGELESKKGFQRQSVTKYLRLTLVSKWRTTGKVLLLFFGIFFGSINKIFILAGEMSTRLSFYEV